MNEEFELTNPRPNPFTAQYKNEIKIKVTDETLAFLKEQALVHNIPYPSLASRFLTQCAEDGAELTISSPIIFQEG